MVFRPALRKAGRLCEELADDLHQERSHSNFDSARRERPNRSTKPESNAVSRAEAVRGRKRVCSVSARAAWVAGREASARPVESDRAVVRFAFEVRMPVMLVVGKGGFRIV